MGLILQVRRGKYPSLGNEFSVNFCLGLFNQGVHQWTTSTGYPPPKGQILWLFFLKLFQTIRGTHSYLILCPLLLIQRDFTLYSSLADSLWDWIASISNQWIIKIPIEKIFCWKMFSFLKKGECLWSCSGMKQILSNSQITAVSRPRNWKTLHVLVAGSNRLHPCQDVFTISPK